MHSNLQNPNPQAPAAPVPPRKRRGRTLLIVTGGIFALIVVGGIFGGGKSGTGATSPTVTAAPAANGDATQAAPAKAEAAPPKVGVEVRDGKFAFTVVKVETGLPTIGSDFTKSTAQGSYVLVHLKVRNIGDKAQLLSDSSQKLIDAQGRKFDADTSAAIMSLENNQTFLNNINPGNEVTGTLVFDVPAGVELAALELHDSLFSGGVKVALTS
jgi:hypothetical protein